MCNTGVVGGWSVSPPPPALKTQCRGRVGLGSAIPCTRHDDRCANMGVNNRHTMIEEARQTETQDMRMHAAPNTSCSAAPCTRMDAREAHGHDASSWAQH